MIRLNSVCIITEDVPRLRAFYRSLLQVEPEGDGDFAAFVTEGLGVTLFSAQGMERMAPGSMVGAGYGGCVLEFGVEDVDVEYERLVALGVPVVKPPPTQPWGLRSAWFRDPEGNIVNLYCRVAEG